MSVELGRFEGYNENQRESLASLPEVEMPDVSKS